jgi:polyhydroxyalkanoate synthesis regulator phasin
MSILKNIVLLGVGMASVTRDKAEEVVEELIKRGEVASADKAKVIDEIQEKAQAATVEVRKIVDERVEAVGKKLRWFEDMNQLRARVEELEVRLAALEKEPATVKARKPKAKSE